MTDPGLIGLTGVTGAVGGRVAELLSDLPLRLFARDPGRVVAPVSADVVRIDYADRDGMLAAFAGVGTLLVVSAAESADRRALHRDVIAAATLAGVRHLVYTSFAGAAPDATFTLGRDHADTEAAIADSGLAATLLRDNLYADLLPFFAADDGVIRGPAGRGRVAAVARADVAAVAATVLRAPAAHAGATYTLTGPEALTLDEVADRAGAAVGRVLRFEDQTLEQAYAQRATDYPGTPQWQLDAWVSTYVAIADGSLAEVTTDVERVTGSPARTLEQALAP